MQKITNIEIKQDKTGNDMKVTTFDSGVKVYVNSKYDAIVYDQVVVGASFEVYKDNKDYWKIKYDRPAPKAPSNYSKTAITEKMMDKKNTSIEYFQDKKTDTIRMAGAIRDGVLITTAIMQHQRLTISEIEETIKYWQKKVYELHDQPFPSAPDQLSYEVEPIPTEMPDNLPEEINPDEIPF